jgi:hypothetical protein
MPSGENDARSRARSPPMRTNHTSGRTPEEPTMTTRALPLLTLLLALAACGERGGARDPDAHGGPVYAVMYEVYDDAGSTSYLSLLDSLDVEEVDLAQAREFGRGRAFIQGYQGKLFVGDAESPTVTRYALSDDGALIEEGTISFANYGLDAGQFDTWNVTFIGPDKAYLLDFKEGTTIVWNPATMEIVGDIPAPEALHRPGLSLEGTPGVVRDGPCSAPSTGWTTTRRSTRPTSCWPSTTWRPTSSWSSCPRPAARCRATWSIRTRTAPSTSATGSGRWRAR